VAACLERRGAKIGCQMDPMEGGGALRVLYIGRDGDLSGREGAKRWRPVVALNPSVSRIETTPRGGEPVGRDRERKRRRRGGSSRVAGGARHSGGGNRRLQRWRTGGLG
jgi:hypothetical protein